MIVDQAARAKLENMRTSHELNHGLDKVVQAIKETSAVKPQVQVKTPANDLADELRNLQKMIGGGNLTESLSNLSKALDSFDVNENGVGQLKTLVADMSEKLRLLAELEVKIPKSIDLNFPPDVEVKGKVDVGAVDNLPPIHVENLAEISQALGVLINNLQSAVTKAIEKNKVEIPSTVDLGGPVHVADFQELLDGIEELKKGFNLLINKEVATVSFPSTTIPVEVINQKVPQPVTNININPLQGFVKTTSATVGTSAVALPTYGQLFNRRSLMIYNNSANTIYIGGSDVTTSNGLPVPAGAYAPSLDAGYNLVVYGIAAQGGNNVRVIEISKDKEADVQG